MLGLGSGRSISITDFFQSFQTAVCIVLAINREVIGGILEFSLGTMSSKRLSMGMMGKQISH